MSIEEVRTVSAIEQKSVKGTNRAYATKPYPNDTVELSTKQEKTKSTAKQTMILAGTMLATLVGASLLFAKRQGDKISKLYKEKLVLSNLPEKIEFKEAKTLEDGIKFAKEVLGIKEVDKEFTLDAINVANRGLVDVSNANKGKLFIPTRLGFQTPTDKSDSYLAYVVKDINSEHFGNLVINKNYFDNKLLDKEIKDFLYQKDGVKYFDINSLTGKLSTRLKVACVRPYPNGDLAKLIEKFYKDSSKLTVKEKQTLFYSLQFGADSALEVYRNPIEHLIKLKAAKPSLCKDIDVEAVKKMAKEKQQEILDNLSLKMEKNGSYWGFEYKTEYPESVIYHEMGHLQDFAKNLKELDLIRWKLPSWKEAWKHSKEGTTWESIKRQRADEVNNRWGSTWKDKYEKMLKDNPKKFEKLYPDLYEFVTNQEIQQTAGKISSYAQSGIGEFIAETYARMVAKREIPEDVMALYRKYKGPELP